MPDNRAPLAFGCAAAARKPGRPAAATTGRLFPTGKQNTSSLDFLYRLIKIYG